MKNYIVKIIDEETFATYEFKASLEQLLSFKGEELRELFKITDGMWKKKLYENPRN